MNIPDDPRIPSPAGHYSPVIEHQGTLYISGQLPMDPETKDVPADVEEQTVRALENLENLLLAAGSDRQHVLQVRIFVSDIDHWEAINRAYGGWFGEHRPARAIIPCGPLHFGCLLELEATAAVR
ncbi:MAG: RidA family protein [Planctomycetota bacterium]|nr:RidA family protein [Planctomycetota bacterium]MEC9046856.1 RidA family protein [Planctomycetota bacterium]